MWRKAALVPRVNFRPEKKSQKARPPPIIPIVRRYFQETFLKVFCFVDFWIAREITRKMIPIARALRDVRISGSIDVTKNLLAITEKPEMIAVDRIRRVPISSFFDTSFMGL